MRWETIHKAAGPGPNMADYESERGSFTWAQARGALGGLPGGRGLNIAYEAVDRHATGPRRDHVALRCIERSGACRTITYAELAERSNRFANALDNLGVGVGERVFVLAPRVVRPLRRRPRHAQAPQRAVSAVLGIRT